MVMYDFPRRSLSPPRSCHLTHLTILVNTLPHLLRHLTSSQPFSNITLNRSSYGPNKELEHLHKDATRWSEDVQMAHGKTRTFAHDNAYSWSHNV